MSRLLKKRNKKAGSPPGTLVYISERDAKEPKYHLIEYTEKIFTEKNNATLKECLDSICTPEPTWVNITGMSDPKAMESIGKAFKLNPLVLEDILNTGQRPKCDDYKDYLFIVLRLFKRNGKLEDEQICLVLGKDYLLTFAESSDDLFEPIRDRLRKEGSRMRSFGVDYLAYAILDMLIDMTYSVLEKMDDELEAVENELLAKPMPCTLQSIQKLKRQSAILRKSIWPLREVISTLQRRDNPLISNDTRFFLHDVYDHTVLMIETIEGFRDILSGMLDIYISNINLRMNEIMKVLTVVATIFVPLTFMASFYGMNFDYMPELHYRYSYPIFLGAMGIVTLIMLFFFRRKNWI